MIKLVKIGDEYASSNYKEFIIDSADDVSSLPTDCAAGSIAVCSDGIKYVLCPSGDWDVMSVGGASSDITSQDIVSALGYTPVKASDVPDAYDDTQIKEDLTTKLTEPTSGLAVGKYFKVASIDENGHAVLEACDAPATDVQINGTSITQDGVANIPIAIGRLGVVSPSSARGLGVRSSDGRLYLINTSNENIDARTKENYGGFGAINSGNLVYAVDSVLCSTAASEALSAEKQAAARARIGAASGKWDLINEITITASDLMEYNINTDSAGNPFELEKCYVEYRFPSNVATYHYHQVNGTSAYRVCVKTDASHLYAIGKSKIICGKCFNTSMYGKYSNSMNGNIESMSFGAESITSIQLVSYNSIPIGSGTKITVYGIRK